MIPEKFYRYEIHQYGIGSVDETGIFDSIFLPTPRLILKTFNLHKETPKGYWIGYGYREEGKLRSHSHWVSKTSKKRFAYPTKEEALNNFIHRSKSRIKHLNRDLIKSKLGIQLAENELKIIK